MNLATIRELFDYNDWMRDRLMRLIEPLEPAQLDKPFEMGLGTLRKTMEHLASVEWMWLQRWKGWSPKESELPKPPPTMKELWATWRQTVEERASFLETITDADLDRETPYTNIFGDNFSYKLGYMLIHVCNHATHHRAQAVNMLRHIGVSTPATDFLIMHKERKEAKAK